MKLIDQIENKISELSGLEDFQEWKLYDSKKTHFLNYLNNLHIKFLVKNDCEKTLNIRVVSPFDIQNGIITLRIDNKLLHKKIINNTFFLPNINSDIFYTFGYWDTFPEIFKKRFFLQKPKPFRLKIISNNIKDDSFEQILRRILVKNNFLLVNNKYDASLSIREKKKLLKKNIPDLFFAQMEYILTLRKKNSDFVTIIKLPNDEFPSQISVNKNRKTLFKQIKNFRNYPNYKWVINQIVEKLKHELKK